jgi:hypothetical protein
VAAGGALDGVEQEGDQFEPAAQDAWRHAENGLVHVAPHPGAMRVVGAEPMGGPGETVEIDETTAG